MNSYTDSGRRSNLRRFFVLVLACVILTPAMTAAAPLRGRVLYVSKDTSDTAATADAYVLDLTTGENQFVLADAERPTWSPDGSQIAFSSDRTGSPQIYVMDSDGLDVKRLTYQGNYNDSPLWSMRGDRLTLVSRTKTGRFNLVSIDVSGADYRVLTKLGTNENPHFSPDGKHLVFSSTRLGGQDIYTMDVSGRNQRRLTNNQNCSNPAWGPLR